MTLDARTRSSLYAKFAELVGDDDANALMSQFPSIEADELVTKQFLRAEMAELRSELRTEMSDLRGEFAGLRTEFADLRTEVRGDVASVRSEIHDLRAEMLERFHQQTVLFGGALGGATALLATIGLLG